MAKFSGSDRGRMYHKTLCVSIASQHEGQTCFNNTLKRTFRIYSKRVDSYDTSGKQLILEYLSVLLFKAVGFCQKVRA